MRKFNFSFMFLSFITYVSETKIMIMKKIILALILFFSFTAINAQTDSLQEYSGTYIFPEGNVIPSVDVILTDGSLSMSSSAGTSNLTKLGIDSFEIVEFSGTALFKRNDEKKIIGVHIEAMGYVMDGQKQENGIWKFSTYYLSDNNSEVILSKVPYRKYSK